MLTTATLFFNLKTLNLKSIFNSFQVKKSIFYIFCHIFDMSIALLLSNMSVSLIGFLNVQK